MMNHKYIKAVVILSFAFFLFIPNSFKPFSVALLILYSVFPISSISFSKTKTLRFLLSGGLLFLMLLISLFLTENLKLGGKKVETSLSLILIPFAFLILNKKKEFTYYDISKFKIWLVISTAIYTCFMILFMYFDENTVYWKDLVVNKYRNIISGFPLIGIHPIYVSFIVGTSLIVSVHSLLLEKLSKSHKVVFGVSSFLSIVFLLMLSSRAVLISLVLIIVLLIWKKLQYFKFRWVVLVFTIVLLFVSLFLNKRFVELIDYRSYEVNQKQYYSANYRFEIFFCSLEVAKENWLLGVGLGDQYDELQKCFKSDYIKEKRYNTHNQYLSYLINGGVICFILFIIMLAFYFRDSYKNKDFLFLLFLIFLTINLMFENLLERQNGIVFSIFILNFLSKSNKGLR